MKSRLRKIAPIVALLGVYAVLVVLTVTDYGVTFDDALHARYGDRILRWYASGFRDRAVLDVGNLEYYGGFFDVLGQIAARMSPLGLYETRHLINAIFAGVGVFAAWRIGFRLAGPRAAFLAALFLLATPVWYGHGFANPKDIPFAALYLLSIDVILSVIPHIPRIPLRDCVRLGIVFGLTMAVRFGGVLLFGYLAMVFVAWLFLRWRTTRHATMLRRSIGAFAGRAALISIVAWVTLLPWWPAAQVDPLRHPLRTLRALSVFEWNFPVFFDGRQIRAMELPATYLPTWLLLKLPEFVWFGVLAALAGALLHVMRRMRGSPPGEFATRSARDAADTRSADRTIGWATIWFAVLFPLGTAIAQDSVFYDGLRHVLFVVPIFAITAAAGFDILFRQPRPARALAATFLIASLGWTVVDMIRLHPYQYIGVNHAFAGGLRNASRSYETDYWGAAFKEGAEWLADTYGGGPDTPPLRVATCSEPTSTFYYLPAERFAIVNAEDAPDLFLGSSRWRCVDDVEGRVVHTVERMGVPLVVIKDTRPATPARF